MSYSKLKQKYAKISKDVCCDVIYSPVITEKSSVLGEKNQFAFYVSEDADKFLIKKAVETLFNVSVKAVNVIRHKGKVKRFRGNVGRRSDKKKAIVTLASGQSIDLTAKIA